MWATPPVNYSTLATTATSCPQTLPPTTPHTPIRHPRHAHRPSPRHQRHQHHRRRRQRQQLTHQLTTINHSPAPASSTLTPIPLANSAATDTIIHSGAHTTLTTNITNTTTPKVRARGKQNGRASTPPPARVAHPIVHRSATRPPPLPLTGRALQPTAGKTTSTSSRPSNTYWQPRPRAHKPTSNPRNRKSPTTPCHHAPYPPRPPQTGTRNTSERSPTPAAPPRPHHPPPKGHLRHAGQHPSPHGRRAVLPVRPTRPP